MNAPLATYSERLLEVRRHFALYNDRVVVEAAWFPNRRFTHTVQLDSLSGEVQEVTIRYRVYRYAGWILAVGALVFAALYYRAQGAPTGAAGYVALGVASCGAALLVLTYRNRRIRFARFRTKNGRVGLDIGDTGNDAAAFDDFIRQVRRQTRR